jgi:serine/threonine protein phosphatase 1
VGDIHGRAELLDALHSRIAEDLQARPAPGPVCVYLGDYVDRGGDSKGVLDRILAAPERLGMPVVALRGNHEEILARFLDDPAVGEDWLQWGGLETLHSYGVEVDRLLKTRDYKWASAELAERLPEAHRALLSRLQLQYREGSYFFCHAGVRPGVALEAQRAEDLLWIREPFLSSGADLGAVVVHGHTPVMEPEIRANRINADTGAYLTGRLTCIVIDDGEIRQLATGRA